MHLEEETEAIREFPSIPVTLVQQTAEGIGEERNNTARPGKRAEASVRYSSDPWRELECECEQKREQKREYRQERLSGTLPQI